jgi:hypothetical protein
LTIVSKRASKVFSNPQHGGNRDFGGGGGGGGSFKMATFFQKQNIIFIFWGNAFIKQQVTKVSNITKFCKFQI